MPLFGPDPKDELITLLANERDYLRAQVQQLQEQLLAIHNANAFRLLHRAPDNDPAPAKPQPLDVFAQKGSVYEPKFTLADAMKKAKGNPSREMD